MFARTLKLLLKPIILLMLILPKFAIGDDMVPYKVLNYVGESSCVFRTLKDRVAESQPRIMGYTPYTWKDKFDDITSLGAIDGMLPDGKKIMTFIVSSKNSKFSEIQVILQDLSKSNIDIIDSIFRTFNPNSCAPK